MGSVLKIHISSKKDNEKSIQALNDSLMQINNLNSHIELLNLQLNRQHSKISEIAQENIHLSIIVDKYKIFQKLMFNKRASANNFILANGELSYSDKDDKEKNIIDVLQWIDDNVNMSIDIFSDTDDYSNDE